MYTYRLIDRQTDACTQAERQALWIAYCADDVPTIVDLFAAADQSLFKRVISNEHHVLRPLLPERNNMNYNPSHHYHERQLIQKSAYVNNSFLGSTP